MNDISQIRFILINTTHPGNIGAAARAIKNMGFNQLYLVSPCNYLDSEAISRSSGAQDILTNAAVFPSVQEAIADCQIIIGTSSRERSLPIPKIDPKKCAELNANWLQSGNKVAILFGQERMGLTNEELALCHYHLYIPCNPHYPSLNIAAAIQIIAYELNVAINESHPKQEEKTAYVTEKVSIAEMEQFYIHLEKTLITLRFLDPTNPRLLMRKLRRIFNKASLEQNEMNILRGILTMINKISLENN